MAGDASPGFAEKIKANILKLCESDSNKKDQESTLPSKPGHAAKMTSKLTRVQVFRNPKYKAHGTKSYVYMMHRYGFNPTLGGPYCHQKRVQQQGKFLGAEGKAAIGGKARIRDVLVKETADGTTGQVSSEDIQNDSLYLTPVTIGTPGQIFKLDFDTGSADLWIWSTELSTSIKSQGKDHSIFDPAKSSTFKKTSGSAWKISYGDGSSASGDVGTDNVTIGGLAIENQSIELASKLSDAFLQDQGDGLLGLAFGTINTVTPNSVKTPVENMIAQNDIPKNSELFTCYLGSWKDKADPDKGESFYTFGFIDEDVVKATGNEIYYTPVDNSQGFWSVKAESMTVNGASTALSGNTAIMDTGTTLALVSDEACKAIYDAIPGAKYDRQNQGYLYPTDTAEDKLPVVTYAIGDKQFTIDKESLGFADAGNGMTYGGIQSRGDMTFDILGDTMLKNIYAIWDVGNLRFGAVQRTDPQNINPETTAAPAS